MSQQFFVGQEVVVLASDLHWKPARVMAVHADGQVDCKYHGQPGMKKLRFEALTPRHIRPAPGEPGLPMAQDTMGVHFAPTALVRYD